MLDLLLYYLLQLVLVEGVELHFAKVDFGEFSVSQKPLALNKFLFFLVFLLLEDF